VADRIWDELGQEINRFLDWNEIPLVSSLTEDGLSSYDGPVPFLETRQRLQQDVPMISIVIATRGRPDSVAETIEGMMRLCYPNYELIVVDNNDADQMDTEDVVRQAMVDHSKLVYVREPHRGLSRARNLGLDAAQGEIVAFTDDDVIPDPNWLYELLRGFSAGENVACVTGLVAPREMATRAQEIMELDWSPHHSFKRDLFDMDAHRPKGNLLYPFSAGVFGGGGQNMTFRADVLRSLGGFDEALGLGTSAVGGEDLDAFYRIVTAGYQLAYEPSALIYHSHYREYASLTTQLYNYGFGLTAYLTKVALTDWRPFLAMLPRVPAGVWYALSPRSEKNRRRTATYPRELGKIELRGMLRGPLGYLRSRRENGQGRSCRMILGPFSSSV